MECSITKSEHGGAGAGVGLLGLDRTLYRGWGAWLTSLCRWACQTAEPFLPSAHLILSLWRMCVHSLKEWVSMATRKMEKSLAVLFLGQGWGEVMMGGLMWYSQEQKQLLGLLFPSPYTPVRRDWCGTVGRRNPTTSKGEVDGKATL